MTRLPNTSQAELGLVEFLNDTAVVTLTTSVLSGPEMAGRLSFFLRGIHGRGARNFILDLQNVTAMDSACVSTLINLLTELQAQRDRGGIALVNAAANVSYLFKLTRLDRMFPICRDVMAALAAVENSPRPAKSAAPSWWPLAS